MIDHCEFAGKNINSPSQIIGDGPEITNGFGVLEAVLT
jgi:hypothetical protein